METEVIISESLSYAGVGDLKSSYSHGMDWLKDELFTVAEDFYKEKSKGDSKNVEIKWTALKNVSDYFRIRLDIKWRVLGMSDVEVEIDGKKKKMNNFGTVKIDVKGTLEKDYNSNWEASGMQRFFKDIYHKFVISGTTNKKQGEVMELVQTFKEEMKAFFDLVCRRSS